MTCAKSCWWRWRRSFPLLQQQVSRRAYPAHTPRIPYPDRETPPAQHPPPAPWPHHAGPVPWFTATLFAPAQQPHPHRIAGGPGAAAMSAGAQTQRCNAARLVGGVCPGAKGPLATRGAAAHTSGPDRTMTGAWGTPARPRFEHISPPAPPLAAGC